MEPLDIMRQVKVALVLFLTITIHNINNIIPIIIKTNVTDHYAIYLQIIFGKSIKVKYEYKRIKHNLLKTNWEK